MRATGLIMLITSLSVKKVILSLAAPTNMASIEGNNKIFAAKYSIITIVHHVEIKFVLLTCLQGNTTSNKLSQKSWVSSYCASAMLDFTNKIQAWMVCPKCCCLPV